MVPDHGQGGFHSVAPFWKIHGQVRDKSGKSPCRAAVRSRLRTHDTILLSMRTHDTILLSNTTNGKRLGHASEVSVKQIGTVPKYGSSGAHDHCRSTGSMEKCVPVVLGKHPSEAPLRVPAVG